MRGLISKYDQKDVSLSDFFTYIESMIMIIIALLLSLFTLCPDFSGRGGKAKLYLSLCFFSQSG